MIPRITSFLAGALAFCHMGAGILSAQEDLPPIPPEIAAMEPHALAMDVKQIFQKSCADCHDRNSGGRKGGFSNVLDLEGMTESEEYLVPGDPGISDIYFLTFDPDPEWQMPPPDADQPQLTPTEIAKVGQWILNGAGMPPAPAAVTASASPTADPSPAATASDATDPAPTATATSEPAPEPSKGAPEKETEPAVKIVPEKVFANLHPLIIHFPIALLLVAALTEFFGIFKPSLNLVSRWSVWIAALGSIPSAVTGWMLAPIRGWTDSDVFLHRWLGVSTAAGCVVALILLEIALHSQTPKLRWAVRLFIWALALLVSVTGHTGGELVYGKDFLFK